MPPKGSRRKYRTREKKNKSKRRLRLIKATIPKHNKKKSKALKWKRMKTLLNPKKINDQICN